MQFKKKKILALLTDWQAFTQWASYPSHARAARRQLEGTAARISGVCSEESSGLLSTQLIDFSRWSSEEYPCFTAQPLLCKIPTAQQTHANPLQPEQQALLMTDPALSGTFDRVAPAHLAQVQAHHIAHCSQACREDWRHPFPCLVFVFLITFWGFISKYNSTELKSHWISGYPISFHPQRQPGGDPQHRKWILRYKNFLLKKK